MAKVKVFYSRQGFRRFRGGRTGLATVAGEKVLLGRIVKCWYR